MHGYTIFLCIIQTCIGYKYNKIIHIVRFSIKKVTTHAHEVLEYSSWDTTDLYSIHFNTFVDSVSTVCKMTLKKNTRYPGIGSLLYLSCKVNEGYRS